jgi:hypothetical protein
MTLELTAAERRRIKRGDYSPLVRPEKPEVERGAVFVIEQRTERAYVMHDRERDEHTLIAGSTEVVLSITVGNVKKQHRKWLVEFSAQDRRDPNRFLAPKTGYTSSAARSTDPDAECIPLDYQRELSRRAEEENERMQDERRREREEMHLTERLESALMHAASKKINVKRKEWKVRKAVESLERQVFDGGDDERERAA